MTAHAKAAILVPAWPTTWPGWRSAPENLMLTSYCAQDWTTRTLFIPESVTLASCLFPLQSSDTETSFPYKKKQKRAQHLVLTRLKAWNASPMAWLFGNQFALYLVTLWKPFGKKIFLNRNQSRAVEAVIIPPSDSSTGKALGAERQFLSFKETGESRFPTVTICWKVHAECLVKLPKPAV